MSCDVPFVEECLDQLYQKLRFIRFNIDDEINIPLHMCPDVTDLANVIDRLDGFRCNSSWSFILSN